MPGMMDPGDMPPPDMMTPEMPMPALPGDVALAQFKLTIPLTKTGIKIPLSVTYANRTESIMEKEVRGNFGITFDLDSILSGLGGQ